MGRTAVMWAATVHTLTTCERSTCIKALKVGDMVYLLRYNDGKKYFILDRKEE